MESKAAEVPVSIATRAETLGHETGGKSKIQDAQSTSAHCFSLSETLVSSLTLAFLPSPSWVSPVLPGSTLRIEAPGCVGTV